MVSSIMKIEENEAVDRPVGREGGRSLSTLSTGQAPTTPGMVLGATETPGAALPKLGPLEAVAR
jgi:hypothetical protein